MKFVRTGNSIEIMNRGNCIFFPVKNGKLYPLEIFAGNKNKIVARSLYFISYSSNALQKKIKSTQTFSVKKIQQEKIILESRFSIGDVLRVEIKFLFDKSEEHLFKLVIKTSVCSGATQPFGLKLMGMIPGKPTREVRLCSGLYSGWTIKGETFVVFPEEGIPESKFSIGTPRNDQQVNYGKYKENGPVKCIPIALVYPPTIDKGKALSFEDIELPGYFIFDVVNKNIFDPVLHARAKKLNGDRDDILSGRYPLRDYLHKYLEFLGHKELFIDMGNKYGLFHRGFYNCTRKGVFINHSDPDKEKKHFAGALLYKHFAMDEHIKNPASYPEMRFFGDYANTNEPLCDIVWGGSNNLLTAYFLYLQNAHITKSEKIINTLLHFKNKKGEGFQIEKGPAESGWWNAYQPVRDVFSSRYYEPVIGIPDQGLYAYYLSNLYLKKYYEDEIIIAKVKNNCQKYLEPKLKEGYLIYHAYDLNNKAGYSREKIPYPFPVPCSCLLTGLAFLSCYRLTGEKYWKTAAYKLAMKVIEKFIFKYKWDYCNYDTLGFDTESIVRILLVLSEFYKEFQKKWIKDAAELSMKSLYTYQHHKDYKLGKYINNEECWGGSSFNYGGFAHGSTYNSRQGLYSLILWADYSEGLLSYYLTFNDPLGYESLMKYLNMLTYHQVVRKDISFGYGSTSEHFALEEGYIQDTFQVSNAMPFGIEYFMNNIYLSSANTKLIKIESNGKNIKLRFERTEKLILHVEYKPVNYFKVFIGCSFYGIFADGNITIDDYYGEELKITAV